MSISPAKFDLNRCNESPLRGEKLDFWPVSKNNTGSLPLRGNPAGKKQETPDHTYVQHYHAVFITIVMIMILYTGMPALIS